MKRELMSQRENQMNSSLLEYTTASKGPLAPGRAEAATTAVNLLDVEKIKSVLKTCGSLPLKHSFFVSHRQDNAGDVAATLSLKLHSLTDLGCWFDQDMEHVTVGGMVKGVAQSAVFLLLLTKGVFERPFILLEVRTAIFLKKKVVMVHESDPRKEGHEHDFAAYFAGCPEDLVHLKGDVESRAMRRKGYEQDALLADVVKECREELSRAADARRPLQVMGLEAAEALKRVGDTAAVFVDLGSGQSVVYLLALHPADGSLEFHEVWSDKRCFLDLPEAQPPLPPPLYSGSSSSSTNGCGGNPPSACRTGCGSGSGISSANRALYLEALRKAQALLRGMGAPSEALFQVFVGATAKYRALLESGPEGRAKVGAVEAWFRGVVQEAGLAEPRRKHNAGKRRNGGDGGDSSSSRFLGEGLSSVSLPPSLERLGISHHSPGGRSGGVSSSSDGGGAGAGYPRPFHDHDVDQHPREDNARSLFFAPLAVEFEVMEGAYEARLEWAAVKAAVVACFGSPPLPPLPLPPVSPPTLAPPLSPLQPANSEDSSVSVSGGRGRGVSAGTADPGLTTAATHEEAAAAAAVESHSVHSTHSSAHSSSRSSSPSFEEGLVDAVLSGGVGSCHVSTDHEFGSVGASLEDGALFVEQHGVAAYRAHLRPALEAAFEKGAARLQESVARSADRPLRLVVISGFFYAAVACKATSRDELVRFRNVDDLVGPAQALLGDVTACAKDKANVARLLGILNVATQGSLSFVEVLMVRNWEVRGKPYKATWATGKFLRDLKERCLLVLWQERKQQRQQKLQLEKQQQPQLQLEQQQQQLPNHEHHSPASRFSSLPSPIWAPPSSSPPPSSSSSSSSPPSWCEPVLFPSSLTPSSAMSSSATFTRSRGGEEDEREAEERAEQEIGGGEVRAGAVGEITRSPSVSSCALADMAPSELVDLLLQGVRRRSDRPLRVSVTLPNGFQVSVTEVGQEEEKKKV